MVQLSASAGTIEPSEAYFTRPSKALPMIGVANVSAVVPGSYLADSLLTT